LSALGTCWRTFGDLWGPFSHSGPPPDPKDAPDPKKHRFGHEKGGLWDSFWAPFGVPCGRFCPLRAFGYLSLASFFPGPFFIVSRGGRRVENVSFLGVVDMRSVLLFVCRTEIGRFFSKTPSRTPLDPFWAPFWSRFGSPNGHYTHFGAARSPPVARLCEVFFRCVF